MKMGFVPVIHLIPHLYDVLLKKKLDIKDVISHQMPLADAEKAYKMFDRQKEECLKIILIP